MLIINMMQTGFSLFLIIRGFFSKDAFFLPSASFIVKQIQTDCQRAAEKHRHPNTFMFKIKRPVKQVSKRNTNDYQVERNNLTKRLLCSTRRQT